MRLRTDEKEKTDTVKSSGTELDLSPEYCHYRDEGCEYAASCLNCPFERCLYEESGGRGHFLKKERNRRIVRLSRTEGKMVKELALIFGVSCRTVQRVLKTARKGVENGRRL